MDEFGYFGECEIPLRDEISITNDTSREFLVANSRAIKAQIYAPEVDFFIENSACSTLEKSRAVSLIYEAKARIYDASRDLEKCKPVGKKVLLLGADEFAPAIKNAGFEVACLDVCDVEFAYGQIGDLCAILGVGAEQSELDCDILLARGAKDFMLKQSGCYEIQGLGEQEILNLLREISPEFKYKQIINFNPQICQYEGRRSEHCGACASICPSVAILKDEAARKLEFSHVDCVACGLCAGVCPSGALDFGSYTKDALNSACELCAGKILLIARDFDGLNLALKSDILPLSFENTAFLDRVYLLSILQNTGANVVIFEPDVSDVLKESVNLINEIFTRIYGCRAVFLAANSSELQSALDEAALRPEFRLEFKSKGENKTREFADRLKPLINNDFGIIKTNRPLSYGKIEINPDTCTLCASCVGACNMGALYANASDNSLRFNASLCTLCGYCEASCAEKNTIKIVAGELELKPSYFEYQILAKDELFACISCGKPFATKKSIEKIASIIAPTWAANSAKLKTLYCCAQCKAQIAMENGDFDE